MDGSESMLLTLKCLATLSQQNSCFVVPLVLLQLPAVVAEMCCCQFSHIFINNSQSYHRMTGFSNDCQLFQCVQKFPVTNTMTIVLAFLWCFQY